MNQQTTNIYWGLIIDTDAYAANFDKIMCAYLIGKFSSEENDVEDFETYLFNESVMLNPSGNCNYYKIYPNPNYLNDGMGFQYKPGEEHEALVKLRESYAEQAKLQFQMYSNNLSYAKERKEYWENKANEVKEPGKYPAFNSLLIFFKNKPNQEQIDFIKNRAKIFAEDIEICIEGFRLIEFKTLETMNYIINAT